MSVYAGSKPSENPTPERIIQLREQAKNGPYLKLAALVLSAFDRTGDLSATKEPGESAGSSLSGKDRT
jgi:hypothetical protein